MLGAQQTLTGIAYVERGASREMILLKTGRIVCRVYGNNVSINPLQLTVFFSNSVIP